MLSLYLHGHKQSLVLLLVVLSLLLVVGASLLGAPTFAGPVSAPGLQAASTTLYFPAILRSYMTSSLWRFGIAQERRPLTAYNRDDILSLRFGWYVDYSSGGGAIPSLGVDYVPMISLKQWKALPNGDWTMRCVDCPYVTPYTYTVSPSLSQIEQMAASRTGLTWIIGNEVDRRDYASPNGPAGMQEMLPEVYAQAYHDLYGVIKGADPTAQVANAAVVEATPLRLKYLQRVWDAYSAQNGGQTMPVDVWNIHIYVLREYSCNAYPNDCWGAGIPAGLSETVGATYSALDNKSFPIVVDQLRAFRTWMQQHGQQNRPLLLTEYGVLMPNYVAPGQFTAEQIRDSMMYPSFQYFLTQSDAVGYPADGYRMVQRWIWYSLDDDSQIDWPGLGRYPALNGNLFWSGLEQGQPQGLNNLGVYWRNYVQSLPQNPARPY